MERTELLLGEEKISRLKKSHILVVGLGGVGSYAAEQLVRAGIGSLTIADGDKVQESNINRQLSATRHTIGHNKTDVLKQRFLEINPDLNLRVVNQYINDDEMESFVLSTDYTFVVDAIDTVAPKLFLIKACVENGINLVSSMGAGARIDPTKVMIADLSKSFNDRLAFRVRRKLRRWGINKGFPVVFSSEDANRNAIKLVDDELNKKSTTGTISYMPAIFGLYCASVVIRKITEV